MPISHLCTHQAKFWPDEYISKKMTIIKHSWICVYVILTLIYILYQWYWALFINIANWAISLMSRVFANGPGNRGSIPARVIPKSQKWYLMPPCLLLNIIRYGSRVKLSNPENGVALSPTPRCSSYWKGSLRVALD